MIPFGIQVKNSSRVFHELPAATTLLSMRSANLVVYVSAAQVVPKFQQAFHPEKTVYRGGKGYASFVRGRLSVVRCTKA